MIRNSPKSGAAGTISAFLIGMIPQVDPTVQTTVLIRGQRYFRYRVKDYFRRYDSPEECFDDHAAFFYRNPRYRLALGVAGDPVQMAVQVARAGYATDPNYEITLVKVIRKIQLEIDKLEKP